MSGFSGATRTTLNEDAWEVDMGSLSIDIVPALDNVFSLGSDLRRWKDLVLAGVGRLGAVQITGLTANSLVATDASSNLVAVTSSSSPVFSGLTVTGGASMADTTFNGVIYTRNSNSVIIDTGQNCQISKPFVNALAYNADNLGGYHSFTIGFGERLQINAAGATVTGDVTVSGLTASSLVSNDASHRLVTPAIANSNGCNTSVASNGAVTFSMTQNLGSGGSPTFTGVTAATVTDTGVAANQLVGTDASHNLVAVTSSTSPSFSGTLTAAGIKDTGLTLSSLVATDGSKNLQSVLVSSSANNGISSSLSFSGSTLTLAANATQNLDTNGNPTWQSVTVSNGSNGLVFSNVSAVGDRIVLWNSGSSSINYTAGVASSTLYHNVPTGAHHEWRINGTAIVKINAAIASALVGCDSSNNLTGVTISNANGCNVSFSPSTLTCTMTQNLDTTGSPSFANITDTGLTASSLVSSNASKQLVSAAITNSNGCNLSVAAGGGLTATMTQNLDTTGTPSFANITDTGLTASALTATNASKQLVSSTITNSNGCNLSVASGGGLTATMTQDLTTTGSPTFAAVTATGTVVCSGVKVGGAGGGTISTYSDATSATWTPFLCSNSSAFHTTGTVYATQTGTYSQIGRTVFCNFTIQTTVAPTNVAGTALFINLPITSGAVGQPGAVLGNGNLSLAAGYYPVISVNGSNGTANLNQCPQGGASSYVNLLVSNWNAGSLLFGSFFYYV